MSNPMANVRVVLVDDHHVVRRGLRSFLDSFDDINVIGEAANGEDLLTQIEAWLPDVVVMDLLMPGGMSGIETGNRCVATTSAWSHQSRHCRSAGHQRGDGEESCRQHSGQAPFGPSHTGSALCAETGVGGVG